MPPRSGHLRPRVRPGLCSGSPCHAARACLPLPHAKVSDTSSTRVLIARAPSVAAAGRSWAPHDFNPPLDFPSSNNGTHRMCASELSLTALALSTLVQHVGPSSRGFDVTLHPRQKPSWWSVCIACLSRDICTASTVLAHRGTLCADECWLSSRTTLGVRST